MEVRLITCWRTVGPKRLVVHCPECDSKNMLKEMAVDAQGIVATPFCCRDCDFEGAIKLEAFSESIS